MVKVNDFDAKNLKVGDQILLIKSNHGLLAYEGQVLTIIGGKGNYSAKTSNGLNVSIYTSSPADEFCLADRKMMSKYLKEKVSKMRLEIHKIEEEITFLDKYETEEDYVAEKVMALIEAKDKKEIVEILKQMKKSNFI
jgi:Cft2 family RNA processing exonuclease